MKLVGIAPPKKIKIYLPTYPPLPTHRYGTFFFVVCEEMSEIIEEADEETDLLSFVQNLDFEKYNQDLELLPKREKKEDDKQHYTPPKQRKPSWMIRRKKCHD